MDNRIHPSWATSSTQRTAIVTQGAPQYLSSDNDPLFQYHRWQANLRILDVTEVKTVPFVPHSRPFVERLIGTIRRELLDHTLFWNAVDLEKKLADFMLYFNQHRVHSSLDGSAPADIAGETLLSQAESRNYRWITHRRGLYQLPMAA